MPEIKIENIKKIFDEWKNIDESNKEKKISEIKQEYFLLDFQYIASFSKSILAYLYDQKIKSLNRANNIYQLIINYQSSQYYKNFLKYNSVEYFSSYLKKDFNPNQNINMKKSTIRNKAFQVIGSALIEFFKSISRI